MLSGENPEQTKHWFVLIDDRYRGPYSQAQIVSTIEQGGLKGGDLIWREGMLDWETLAKVAAFNLEESSVKADPQLGQSALSFLDYLEPSEENFETRSPLPQSDEVLVEPTIHPPPLAFNTEFWLPESAPPQPFYRRHLRTFLVCTAGMVTAASLYLFTRSGFPILKDVSAREMAELRAAALEDPAIGDFAAVAMVPGNLREPRFYISTNAQDGSLLDVQLVGLRESMVDSFYYSASATVRTNHHYAKTTAFTQGQGKPLSLGEYSLRILSNGVLVAQKTFFLGGVRDQAYEAKLAAYQSRIRVQAEGEMSEIRQVTGLLEKQLAETQSRLKDKKAWPRFHPQWTALQAQIEILFKEVSPEILNREFYYGPLYSLLNEATQDVSRLHELHNNAMNSGIFDQAKIADLSRSAQAKLLSLRAKILQAERQTGL